MIAVCKDFDAMITEVFFKLKIGYFLSNNEKGKRKKPKEKTKQKDYRTEFYYVFFFKIMSVNVR